MTVWTRRACLFVERSALAAAVDLAAAVMPEGPAERGMFRVATGRSRWAACHTALTAETAAAWLAFAEARPDTVAAYLTDAATGLLLEHRGPASSSPPTPGQPWGWSQSLPDFQAAVAEPPTPHERWAAPGGSAGGEGTPESPISLAAGATTAGLYGAGGPRTLYLLPGTYAGSFVVSVPGLRILPAGDDWSAVVDGRIEVTAATADVTIERLRITYSGWTTRQSGQEGSSPSDIPILTGLHLFGPRPAALGCRIDNVAGVGLWESASPGRFEGNLTHDIGWAGKPPDHGHGHDVYIQGTGHAVRGNLLAQNYSDYGIHGYGGADAGLADFSVVENACYKASLIGGYAPVTGLEYSRNAVRGQMLLGYGTDVTGQSAEVADNVAGPRLVRGTWSALTETGTRDFGTVDEASVYPLSWDARRAIVVVHNAAGLASVAVDLSDYGPGRLVWWQDPAESMAFSPGVVDIPTAGWGVAVPAGDIAPIGESTAPGFLAFLVIPG